LQVLSVAAGAREAPSAKPAPTDGLLRGDALDISLPASMTPPEWQAVATGLKLIQSALFAALCGILLTACIAAFPPSALFVLLYYVVLALIALVGLSMCCRAPAEMRGRLLAPAALIVAVGGTMLFIFVTLTADLQLVDRRHWGALWSLLVYVVVSLTLIGAQMCWLLFLRELAIHLDGRELARRVRGGLVAFALWASMLLATPWLDRQRDLRADAIMTLYYTAMIIVIGWLMVINLRALGEARRLLTGIWRRERHHRRKLARMIEDVS
jgi:hypothetical protein